MQRTNLVLLNCSPRDVCVIFDDDLQGDDKLERLRDFEQGLASCGNNEPSLNLLEQSSSGFGVQKYFQVHPDHLQATMLFWVTGGKLSESQKMVSTADL